MWEWIRVPVLVQTIALLGVSNVFMTFAWYAHLKELNHKPWLIAALISWGVALFEYLFQVPANRIGFTQYSIAELKHQTAVDSTIGADAPLGERGAFVADHIGAAEPYPMLGGGGPDRLRPQGLGRGAQPHRRSHQ